MGGVAQVRLALSSRAENVTVVRQALAGLADATGLSRADLNDIGTAVTEACNNVSSHAYEGREGPLEVELRTNAETVVVTVRDRGVGITPEDDSAVEFPSDVDGELAGIGLPSIKALTSSARWSEPAGGGTEVEMTFATAPLAPQIPGSDNGGRRGDDEAGELSAGEPSWHADAVEVGMKPVAVARRVLPRLLRVMASRARFSLERQADVERVAAAGLGAAVWSWTAGGVRARLLAAGESLEVAIGPISEQEASRLAVAVGAAEPKLQVSTERLHDGPQRLVLRLDRSPAGPRSARPADAAAIPMSTTEQRNERRGWAIALLVETGAMLSTSLDPATTISHVAGLTIPKLADLCVIDLRDEAGAIAELAAASADPELAMSLEELRSRWPLDPSGDHPVARVIRTGEPELLAEMSPDSLRSYAEGSEHARFMIANRYRSAIVAPLTARGRTLGALSALRLGDSVPYDEDDLQLVCELARRAALAIDNAQLFSDLSSVEQRLQGVLENLAEAITVVDDGGRTVFANGAALRLLGLESAEELSRAKPGEIMSRFAVLSESGEELELESMPARRLFRGEAAPPLLVRNIVRATGEQRWIVVRASPIVDPASGRVMYAANVFEDVTQVKRAQLAEAFMAQASRVLASSMDYVETLQRVAKLAAGGLADWCAVDVIGERGQLERVAIHHVDPDKLVLAEQLDRYRPTLDDPAGIAFVARSGKARIFNDLSNEALTDFARDGEHLRLLHEMGTRDVIIVPLAAPTRTLGALTLVSSHEGRRLTEDDLALAVRLGRRAGTAVESARLYTERTRIARVLQRALLPDSPPQMPGFEVAARYRPAGELNEVGGDFYDVFPYGEGGWLLVIGDVCGKGAEARQRHGPGPAHAARSREAPGTSVGDARTAPCDAPRPGARRPDVHGLPGRGGAAGGWPPIRARGPADRPRWSPPAAARGPPRRGHGRRRAGNDPGDGRPDRPPRGRRGAGRGRDAAALHRRPHRRRTGPLSQWARARASGLAGARPAAARHARDDRVSDGRKRGRAAPGRHRAGRPATRRERDRWLDSGTR